IAAIIRRGSIAAIIRRGSIAAIIRRGSIAAIIRRGSIAAIIRRSGITAVVCRRKNGTAITAIGRRWGYSAVVALWGCRLGGVVRLRVLWLFVLLRCGVAGTDLGATGVCGSAGLLSLPPPPRAVSAVRIAPERSSFVAFFAGFLLG
ncbi:hypothetical protein, partial [Cardiobacterium hominis]|uniref:hypothetical protein n=1 Tax=Cardiobacterium hominis TaxID=2718 RepID=UPI0028D75837